MLQYSCVILLRSAAVSSALGAFSFEVSFVRRDQIRAHAVSSCLFGFDVPVGVVLCYTCRLFYLVAHLPAQHGSFLLSHSFGSSCVIQSLFLLRLPQNPHGCCLRCAQRFSFRSLRSLRASRKHQAPRAPTTVAAPAVIPIKKLIIVIPPIVMCSQVRRVLRSKHPKISL